MLVKRGEIDGEQFLSSELVKEMFASHWSLNRTGDNGLSSGESEPNGHRDSLMTDYGLSIHRISMRDWGFDEGPPCYWDIWETLMVFEVLLYLSLVQETGSLRLSPAWRMIPKIPWT